MQQAALTRPATCDSAEKSHVDGLSAGNTAGTDTVAVFASADVSDGADDYLDEVVEQDSLAY